MRTVIAHGHIFKNAGTTFDYALEKNFGDGFCDHRDDKPMLQQGVAYLQHYLEEHPDINAISSHHMCDTSGIKGIKVIPVYMLRHPIERALSAYTFERNQDAQTPGAIAAKKYNFKDYVKWRMKPEVSPTIRNYQTIYLAGEQKRKPSKTVDIEVFNTAMKNASKSLVGIVEKFDDSMLMFENMFLKNGIKVDLSFLKKNVSNDTKQSHDSRIASIADDLGGAMATLMNNNAFDLALYHAVANSLRESFDSRSEQDINDFKHRCAKHDSI